MRRHPHRRRLARYTPLSIPGRIEAENYNLGGEGIAYHDTTPGNSGGKYRNDGVDIEYTASEASHNLGWIRNGEWVTYTATVQTSGSYSVTARVASPNTGCQARLAVDGAAPSTIAVPNTGSYSKFTNVSVPVMLTAGEHVLTLTFDGDGQNMNWLQFDLGTPPPSEQYRFITKWGSEGAGNGQFTDPLGVAVDNSGDVYVTDIGNGRVEKFTSSGTFITSWDVSRGARDVAVDHAGNVYVLGDDRVQKFTQDGSVVLEWGSMGTGDGQFKWPSGIGVDIAGNVYVADADTHRVQKFTSSGTFVTKWGRFGSGNGMFETPTDVAVDGAGYVYVTEWNNNVQKFTSDGVFITKWGSVSRRVAVDAAGNVYVTGGSQVQKLTSSGFFITSWGSEVTGDGQFNDLWGIAVDGYRLRVCGRFRKPLYQEVRPRVPDAHADVTVTPTTGPYQPARRSR